jgi:Ca-activated chloride channel family protein
VLCRFTSFVAVDSRVVNQGGAMKRVTQPVDSPSGWDMPADEADGMFPSAVGSASFGAPTEKKRMRTAGGFGPGAPAPAAAAAPLPAPRATRSANYCSAPAAPGAAPMFSPAPSPSLPAPMVQPELDLEVPELRRDEPAAVGARSQSVDVRARISTLLERLRTNVSAPYAERVSHLAEIAAELRRIVLDADGQRIPPEQVEALGTLADELEQPLSEVADQGELDRRWQHAGTVLAGLAEVPEPPRRAAAFWKRRS